MLRVPTATRPAASLTRDYCWNVFPPRIRNILPSASDSSIPIYFSFSTQLKKLKSHHGHLICEKRVRSRRKCWISNLYIIQFLINYLFLGVNSVNSWSHYSEIFERCTSICSRILISR